MNPAFLAPSVFTALPTQASPPLSCQRGDPASANVTRIRFAMSAEPSSPNQNGNEPALTKSRTFYVNPVTGAETAAGREAIRLESAELSLPTGEVPALGISTTREATALVYSPAEEVAARQLSIVFVHGFAQHPRNTKSLLCTLAATGRTVLAPTTCLLDVVCPWSSVKTTTCWSSAPAKLQTALLIDSMRAIQWVKSRGYRYHIMGHSMGGAIALVAGWWLAKASCVSFRGVGVMSPSLWSSFITNLNPVVALDEEKLEKMAREFPGVPLLVLHGTADKIVPGRHIQILYSATKKLKKSITGVGDIINGTHFGYEDLADSKTGDLLIWIEKVLSFILSPPFCGAWDLLCVSNAAQLAVAKATLKTWVTCTENAVKFENLKAMVEKSGTCGDGVRWKWHNATDGAEGGAGGEQS